MRGERHKSLTLLNIEPTNTISDHIIRRSSSGSFESSTNVTMNCYIHDVLVCSSFYRIFDVFKNLFFTLTGSHSLPIIEA